ncbi:MAG: YggT family protein [Bacillota bacterium]
MSFLIIRTVDIFLNLLNLLILLRIIFSIVRIDPRNRYYLMVYQLTEPILEPFRKLIHKLGIETGMFDFSPLVASLFLHYLVKPVLISLLYMFIR